MKKIIYFLFVLIYCSLAVLSQEKAVEKSPDEVFKLFAEAFLKRDLEKMKEYSVFTENIELVKQLPKLEEKVLASSLKDLKELPIKWYAPGEVIKIHGSQISVNDVMSNDQRKIGNIKLLEMVYPIALRKLRTGEWKVDPYLMLQSINKSLEIERKKNRRNFRVEIDGQLVYLNENEEIEFEDKDGKSHKMTLFKNAIQHYKDGRISFSYHRDIDVYPGKGKNFFVYTMTSDMSPELHLLVYDKGVNKDEEMKKFIDIWIENYKIKEAVFEEKVLKETKQEINGREINGKILYVKMADSVYYNQFYFFELRGAVIGVFARSKTVDIGILNQYMAILCENIQLNEGKK